MSDFVDFDYCPTSKAVLLRTIYQLGLTAYAILVPNCISSIFYQTTTTKLYGDKMSGRERKVIKTVVNKKVLPQQNTDKEREA